MGVHGELMRADERRDNLGAYTIRLNDYGDT